MVKRVSEWVCDNRTKTLSAAAVGTKYSAEQTTLKGWGTVLVGWLAHRDLGEGPRGRAAYSYVPTLY